MIRRILAVALFAAALPAAAQSVPAANYSDIWYNANESGWGVTFTQHTDNAVEAVWYTYDPRTPDTTNPANFKPLWIVMPGGTWTSPTVFTGDVFVTVGTPYAQAWNPSALGVTKVGTFTFTFQSAGAATFQYNIAPPANLPSTDAAFGLPAFSGTKSITRQQF